MLDTDFYTPRQEGIEAVDIEAVKEKLENKEKKATKSFREIQRLLLTNMYGITSVKGVI